MTPLCGKATICTLAWPRWRSRAASTPSSLASRLSRSMSTWVRRCVVPCVTHSRIRLPARSSVETGRYGRIFLSVSMRLIRVGPADCPIQGRPISVLSRCMWPSTRPGSTKSPPISRVGMLFDSDGATSPSVTIRPPAIPISARRPSASRQWLRSASSVAMARSFSKNPQPRRGAATDVPVLSFPVRRDRAGARIAERRRYRRRRGCRSASADKS